MSKFGNRNQEHIADVFDGDSLPSMNTIDNVTEMKRVIIPVHTHLPQIIEIRKR